MKIGIGEQQEIDKKLLELVDFIEVKTLTSENTNYFSQLKKPFLFHVQNFAKRNKVFAGDDDLVKFMKDDEVKKIINSSHFSWFSLHLGLPVKSFVFDDNQDFVATSKPISKKEFFDKVSKNLQAIKKLYPKKKILLETPPFVPHSLSKGAYYYICEPGFINELLDKNDCYFLLDIGHATVSAYNLGYKNPTDYFVKLPLGKTIEVHIHRPRKRKQEGLWRDAHLPITDTEIKSLEFVLSKAKNTEAIVLEAQGLHSTETMTNELRMLQRIKEF